VLAARSHYYEFEELGSGHVCASWELQPGRHYSVILTTGGGLYRYRLRDVVEVTGFFGAAPCLRFVRREGVVSDLVGEKLHLAHVQQVLRRLRARVPEYKFAMLAPHRESYRNGYVLFLEPCEGETLNAEDVRRDIELGLMENYHYRHAVNIGQLRPLRLFVVTRGAKRAYFEHLAAKGIGRGDIKFSALSLESEWEEVFEGAFANHLDRTAAHAQEMVCR
jgi:hypothetical protein